MYLHLALGIVPCTVLDLADVTCFLTCKMWKIQSSGSGLFFAAFCFYFLFKNFFCLFEPAVALSISDCLLYLLEQMVLGLQNYSATMNQQITMAFQQLLMNVHPSSGQSTQHPTLLNHCWMTVFKFPLDTIKSNKPLVGMCYSNLIKSKGVLRHNINQSA